MSQARVLRGGGWSNGLVAFDTTWSESDEPDDTGSAGIGFRCAE